MVLAQQPLVLVQSIELPEVPAGPYADHMALDLKGQRLFTTPQANKAVDVLDLQSGKVLHTIPGFGNPHAVFYRGDRNRLFVTDGGIGALRIFDATSFRELKSIKLELNADGIGYDAQTGYLYVSNGGDEAGKAYSLISIIDTVREEKIGDIRVEAPGLEAMVIDHSSGRLFINLPESSSIAVIDLNKRAVIATWPLTKGKKNMASAYDPEHHRLYVGCRDTDESDLCFDRRGRSVYLRASGKWKLQGARPRGYSGYGQDSSLLARTGPSLRGCASPWRINGKSAGVQT